VAIILLPLHTQTRGAGVFEEPVDTEKLNVPDYFEIVKNPMCLQVVLPAAVICESADGGAGREREDRDGHV
jgi:hypothetical protein